MDEYVVVFEGDGYDCRSVCTNNNADTLFDLDSAIYVREMFQDKHPEQEYNIYKLTRVEE